MSKGWKWLAYAVGAVGLLTTGLLVLLFVPRLGWVGLHEHVGGYCFAITVLLVLVALSYIQTIQGYPSGGGSYVVSRENLGTLQRTPLASALRSAAWLTPRRATPAHAPSAVLGTAPPTLDLTAEARLSPAPLSTAGTRS